LCYSRCIVPVSRAAQAPATQHRRQSAAAPGRAALLFTGDAAMHPTRHGSGPTTRRRPGPQMASER